MRLTALWAGLLSAVLLAYSNHFQNGFHFDDSHTIESNPYIRDLRYIPKLLSDARTSTPHIQNQIYRPLVSVSLAVDYWMGGGLRPFWFHVSTFLWYLVLLALLYACFVRIMDRTSAHAGNRYLALFAVAWYALHPVSAETLNYVYQRGELYATVGVVGGLVAYAAFPRGRRFGLYLLPALLGMLAKQTALMFAPLLFVYVLLFETDWKLGDDTRQANASRTPASPPRAWPGIRTAAIRSLPAFVLCGGYYLFQRGMTPSTWEPGGASALSYWYTQPIVLLGYFTSFFLPIKLSADTDRGLVTSVFSGDFIVGVAFIVAAAAGIWRALGNRNTRPVAFGMLWFFLASLPTSLLPLAEVENDHRMFLPFVGVVLAVCWGGALILRLTGDTRRAPAHQTALVACALLLLSLYGYGTYERNTVWRTEETLWRDVTIKSPRNGRGLMNYGLVPMARGDYRGALQYFQRAEAYTPNYYVLQTNLGIAYGGLGDAVEAERHFRQSIALSPRTASSYFFYARWLKQNNRASEAMAQLLTAIELNPDELESRHLLMQIYFERGDATNLKNLATATLARFPDDAESTRYLAADPLAWLRAAERAARAQPSPASLLNLSLYYEQAGRHEECIEAAREAIALRPDFPEAYNNIAAAYASMKRWDEAIEAAQRAVTLKPDFQLAQNNLRFALDQKNRQQASGAPRP